MRFGSDTGRPRRGVASAARNWGWSRTRPRAKLADGDRVSRARTAEELQRRLREERDVLVATGLGELADDILRIGHMGHNARISRVDEAMDALGDVL